MLAHRRDDVRELNEAARALLCQRRPARARRLEAGEREFRFGDRVLCRHNDDGSASATAPRHASVAVGARDRSPCRPTAAPSRQLHARYAAEHLDHGYALTGHAAQGATVERAFVLVRDRGRAREWGYVASRARTETRLYAVGPELSPDEGLARIDPGPATRYLWEPSRAPRRSRRR